MQTECSPELFAFAPVEGRTVVAGFDGGTLTSDAGALLLGATDQVIGLTRRFAACFQDARNPAFIEHDVATLVGQRIIGIALGYEDLIDHDQLRHDPVLAVLAGKLEARRSDCAPLAGKSTLNRLELAQPEPSRYAKISAGTASIERLFVDMFLDAHAEPAKQILLDLDATDDPLHGEQEGRFFHGYYDCYCYLPLYVFCGRHLLAAKLRPSDIDGSAGAVEEVSRIVAQIRARWPKTRILLRADSGFAREELMAWCEANRVDYLFGRRDPADRQAGASLQGFPLVHAEKLEPPAARGGEGRMDPGRGQSALRGDLAQARRSGGAVSLRDDLLCPRRDGEPDQGVPARPVRRPHVRSDHAGQSAASVVRLAGLCAALRAAPDRAGEDAVCCGHLRDDTA